MMLKNSFSVFEDASSCTDSLLAIKEYKKPSAKCTHTHSILSKILCKRKKINKTQFTNHKTNN